MGVRSKGKSRSGYRACYFLTYQGSVTAARSRWFIANRFAMHCVTIYPLLIDIRRLIWDDWNEAHIARHDVVRDEVEEACLGDPYTDEGKKDRIRLIGPTNIGRMLAVILDPEEEKGVYYPVTARPASRKERRLYLVRKGGVNR